MQVIDGTGYILGRLATYVAKQALEGEEIVIINAQNVLITGSRDDILADYKNRRNRGVTGRNRKGPYYPRMPDRLVRRSIRGMIPYQQPRGKAAYERVMAYIGVPKEFEGAKLVTVENARYKGSTKKMTVGDISVGLGANF
ncbi:MAG: 50S ribosomal protein L13 [Thermoplasmata archaeon]|nr:50S ribosomal protein L13 [Thermoplasmata archaeon]